MKINLDKIARKVEVDNRYPLHFYYRIADNLLRQASIHREENNVIDLYIILLRFSSLVTETIPFHRDYQNFQREKTLYKKKLLTVIEELEYLKPEFNRRVEELNKDYDRSQQLDGPEATSYGSEQSSVQWPYANQSSYTSIDNKQSSIMVAKPSWQYDNNHSRVSSSNSSQIDRQFQKLGISLPLPKQETLSRHSFLGPNGLRGQWQGPTPEIKVQYPSTTDISSAEKPTLNQDGQSGIMTVKDSNSVGVGSAMESVLSLDDGRWIHSSEEPCKALVNEMREDPFQFVSIRQPSPPPVLAQVHQQPIPPHRVADPRPGPANSSQDEMPTSNSYQHLHVAVNMMEEFLRLASANTQKNLETCGVLAGSLRNKVFHITTLIIPKQESTSDSCQTLNEEEIFEVQDRLSLFPLGWIHTHPTQTCFMSSVDLHTHYSYQIMLPEAIAIVMAPTDSSSPHGIFHLSDPGGVNIIRNCEQRGFHPHEEPLDGSPIYEHCSHVYMNSKLKYDIVDLR